MTSVKHHARNEPVPVQIILFQYKWLLTIQPTALPRIPKKRYHHVTSVCVQHMYSVGTTCMHKGKQSVCPSVACMLILDMLTG